MESIVRLLYWIRIAASAIVLFGIIAAVVMLKVKSPLNLFIAIPVAIAGIVLGVMLAERARKKGGTIEFASRVNASKDFDEMAKSEDK